MSLEIIGSSWWSTVQFLYLMGKYQSNSCIFFPVTIEPFTDEEYKVMSSGGNPVDLNWVCTGSSAGAALASSGCKFEFPSIMSVKDFISFMRECIDESGRLSIIPLRLLSSSGNHANILCYDKIENTLERYEPHGAYTLDIYSPNKLDKSLPILFEKILGHPVTYFPPKAFCPLKGTQMIEEIVRETQDAENKEGYCSIWSFIYANERLKNPEETRENVVKELIEKIENYGAYDYIRNIIDSLLILSEEIRSSKTTEEIESAVHAAVENLDI